MDKNRLDGLCVGKQQHVPGWNPVTHDIRSDFSFSDDGVTVAILYVCVTKPNSLIR